jgi:hypothetical protein
MAIRSHLVIAFLLLPVAASAVLAADAPRAVFSETHFSFDTVMQGTPLQYDCTLKNEGQAPLKIATDSITDPLVLGQFPVRIAPGDEVVLRVRLDTTKLNGRFEGRVVLSLNDPALTEATLIVEGTVAPPVELLPPPVLFVSGQRGSRRQSTIEIVNHEPARLRILSVEHSVDRFTTRLETVEDGGHYQLILTLNPDGPAGRKTETIRIRTSSRLRPVIEFPVNTYLRERVYAFPEEMDLGAFRLADIAARPDLLQDAAQTLTVYQSGGTDFRIRIRTELPMLEFRTERGPNGDRYQSTVILIGDKLRAGAICGSIVVETNDPDVPILRIPVHGKIF